MNSTCRRRQRLEDHTLEDDPADGEEAVEKGHLRRAVADERPHGVGAGVGRMVRIRGVGVGGVVQRLGEDAALEGHGRGPVWPPRPVRDTGAVLPAVHPL